MQRMFHVKTWKLCVCVRVILYLQSIYFDHCVIECRCLFDKTMNEMHAENCQIRKHANNKTKWNCLYQVFISNNQQQYKQSIYWAQCVNPSIDLVSNRSFCLHSQQHISRFSVEYPCNKRELDQTKCMTTTHKWEEALGEETSVLEKKRDVIREERSTEGAHTM